VLVRYQALPDDMKAALEPRLLPVQAPAEPASAGETGTGSHGFRLEPAPGSRYEPDDAPAAAFSVPTPSLPLLLQILVRSAVQTLEWLTRLVNARQGSSVKSYPSRRTSRHPMRPDSSRK